MVHPGNLVRANDTTPLVVINQLAPINVSFAVPEAQLTSLKRYLAEGAVHVSVQQPGEGKPVAGRIAFKLRISEKTVRNHISHIYEKLDIYDRSQAVLYAVRKGLVEL